MSSIDVEGLKRLSGDDEEFVTDILKLYTERTESDLFDLQEAKHEENWNQVRFIVHRMRSSAVPLGLKDLVVQLRKVEDKLKKEEIEGVSGELDVIIEKSGEALLDARKRLEIV